MDLGEGRGRGGAKVEGDVVRRMKGGTYSEIVLVRWSEGILRAGQ